MATLTSGFRSRAWICWPRAPMPKTPTTDMQDPRWTAQHRESHYGHNGICLVTSDCGERAGRKQRTYKVPTTHRCRLATAADFFCLSIACVPSKLFGPGRETGSPRRGGAPTCRYMPRLQIVSGSYNRLFGSGSLLIRTRHRLHMRTAGSRWQYFSTG